MKKIYVLILTLIVGGLFGFLYFYNSNSSNSLMSESMTPKQIWENQQKERREKGESEKTDKPDEFTKYFKAITTKFGQEDNAYPMNYRVNELGIAKAKRKSLKLASSDIVFVQRGPANVGGRTRGLIVDPDDNTHNSWYAGAATGGIWKTTDGGQTWRCLTDEFPNLSANTLAMSKSNHNIIYVGTGESFPGGTYLQGSGIFKSTDKGENWEQLTSTTNDENFEYVNRLVINPKNPDIIVVATESGIMKSSNGGSAWTKVYTSETGIEDLKEDPNNFNNLYAAENSVGVLKTINAGDNWNVSSSGITGGDRFEIAVSPVNTSIIYASQNISSTESYIYRSVDAGANWARFQDKNNANKNFLGGQGTYDNIVTAHPYNENIAFLGGVNLWKVDFSDPGTDGESSPMVLNVDLENTDSFLSFIDYGGTYLNGGMETGDNNGAIGLVASDWTSVEIRFGSGLTQKAHRFTVPATSGTNGDGGAGVPAINYEYQDYVDVPFQAWDVTNNRQLMVSFRDQERDGKFNLLERDPDDAVSGREYFMVQAETYDATNPSSNIAKDGGHVYKQLYYFWPTLAGGGIWDENNLPDSKILIDYGTVNTKSGTTYNVSDAYGSTGNNTYNQSAGFNTTSIPGIHPDHHNIVIVPINEEADSFLVINANDGGLGISYDSGNILNQLPNNYITTQFYGVAKKPGVNEFIGGMQDNGTWMTQAGENSTNTSEYLFQIGGDGFECVWHSEDDQKIIGSVYNNSFSKTTNGGITWSTATTGITANDGPFISRLSTHKNTPDKLYAVGAKGVYKSVNFATSWTMKTVGEGWTGNGSVTSQHNVEVSLANENIIWAGAAMSEKNGWKIFVSEDQGETFSSVTEFPDADLSGFISGIATHPTQDSTAYLLFSFPGEPKVLRTKDLGLTWEDISGFVGNTSSSNGFPDVVTHSLVVIPDEPNTIWVGTDIGLFESNDDGVSWHYADNGLPAVSVYDMFTQDDEVVIATHGRGIWTAKSKNIPELKCDYVGQQSISNKCTLFSDADLLEVYLNNVLTERIDNPKAGLNEILVNVAEEGIYELKIISYTNDIAYESNIAFTQADFKPIINSLTKPEGIENTILISAEITENYDSLQIILNSELNGSVTDLEIGTNIINTEVSSSKTHNVKVIGYIEGVGYTSNTKYISVTYVGISDVFKTNSLKVYPNPSKGNINVDLPESFNKTYNIDVYSLSGAKVYSTRINKSDNNINLENLKDGLYIIRLENKGELYTQKIQIRR